MDTRHLRDQGLSFDPAHGAMNSTSEAALGADEPRRTDDGRDRSFDYDAFATYATDPDGDLIRVVEAFVEGFHRRPTLPQRLRRELELCVDGRDFRIPRRSRNVEGAVSEVSDIVESYMRRCRALIVFAGPLSKDHPWIDHEIRWWLTNRKHDPLYFALTHGASTSVCAIQPKALAESGGGDLAIFFDLRGFHTQMRWGRSFRSMTRRSERMARIRQSLSDWRSVRPFEEEAAKLVARLLADSLCDDISVAEIEEAWAADERHRRTWRMIGACCLAAVGLAAGWALWSYSEAANAAKNQAKADSWLQRARVLMEQGGAALPTALAYSASALVQRPDGRSVDVGYGSQEGLVPIERIIRPDGGDAAGTAEFVPGVDAIATGGRSSVLRLIDIRNDFVRARLDLKAAGIRSIAYDETSRTFFVGTDRGLVRVELRISAGGVELVETGRVLAGSRIGGLAIDSERKRILVGLLANGELWAFPLATGSEWSCQDGTNYGSPVQ